MLWLIPAMPLVGVLVNGLVAPLLKGGARKSLVSVVGPGVVGVSFVLSILQVLRLAKLPVDQRTVEETLYTWIQAGGLDVGASFLLDPLSAVMILVITGVGFIIHVYSVGYMGEDPGYWRYFTYLNLFVFAMLLLVMGANFLLLFVGWEGVGLCSYLLIGFFYKKKSAGDAGKKAFIVNRVGDVGFAIGVMWIFLIFGTLDFTEVSARAGDVLTYGGATVTAITLFLFFGATGKSAQIPLYVWLPDAMEGPTPVSALIHAATMVTAGIYMVIRASALFVLAPTTLTVIAVIGALTAIGAATIGITQNDIKRVLAYSTVSQLGYMFLALGVGAFGAALFHVFTHAFFKACLFLGSGSVIHALHEEQDMRNMGGLKPHMPITYWTFLISTLALAGIVPFSGFFSKDEILWATLSNHHYVLYGIGVVAAFCTAFYMFRAVFMTFHGECRASAEKQKHLHESPWVMAGPLVVLAAFAALAGFLGVPEALGGSNHFHHWLEPAVAVSPVEGHPIHSHAVEYGAMALSLAVAGLGIFLAYTLYLKPSDKPKQLSEQLGGVYRAVLNKYYVDEAYDAAIVKPIEQGSRKGLWKVVDEKIIDGMLVNGAGAVTKVVAEGLSSLQSGRIQAYTAYAVVGAILLGLLLWS